MKKYDNILKLILAAYRLVIIAFSLFILAGGLLIYRQYDPSFSVFKSEPVEISVKAPLDPNRIENGIHVRTGLKDGEGLMTVVNNCTNCHSSKLIVQNRMNKERWNATIKWMQETQNLWPLGENQEIIVNYLVTHYPVKSKGRRENLSNIDWYELEN